MLTKEELVNTYIKYSSDITEEIFDKVVDKLEGLGFKKYSEDSRNKEYEYFEGKNFPYLRINCNYWFVGFFGEAYKEIQVFDILGENNQFVLPEKWCVKSTKTTIKVINDFIKSKGYESTLSNNYYIHYPFLNGMGAAYDSIQHGYTEITFEQFKQHVLKESVKEVKSIEKWSVGSYVVALENYILSKNILKGDIRKINEPDINNNKIFGELVVNSWQEDIILPKWKWFPTLAEAEAFSKSLLEPKPLTVDDLVEGEIYYCLNNTICLWGKKDSTHSINPKSKDFWNAEPGRYTNEYGFRLTTPEEKKWLLTCIKQDKFIEQSELDKYDSEGNLISEFKVGDYVITKGYSDSYDGRLLRITKFSDVYPDCAFFEVFDSGYYKVSHNFEIKMISRKATPEEIASATKPETKEPKEMQLSDLKNPIFNVGDKVRVIAGSLKEFNSSWFEGNQAKYKKGYEGLITGIDKNKSYFDEVNTWYYLDDKAITCNLLELVEPVKKEFDRDWYVEVNSQEEADLVFQYLESVGERIVSDESFSRKYLPDVGMGYKYIYYLVKVWFLGENPRNIPQKQLSDILPNYSSEPKVNRNVYYEVETQEQYNEILDWLESRGEVLNENTRTLRVYPDWKYVVFNLSIWDSWALYNTKPSLLKEEFQFKDKPETQPIKTGIGLSEQILQYQYQYEYKPINSLSVWEILMNPPTQNSRAELKQEPIKLVSFEEDDVVLFKTNSVKISNKQLIIND